ncbi:MAG TPA: pitrilysin family protein [Hyphomicrobium sp.]|jgi:predicted Zn-dependent peptidase
MTSPTITTLNNGLRVVTHTMPHLETVSLGLWVGAGARHETEREHGISHFLEHMAFKGTRRRSAQQIAEEIEEVGGELNAATSLETTAYFARVLKGDEGVALGLIADILQNSVFARPELEGERQVILQEIAATRDSPDDVGYDLLNDAAFPHQPVGRAILGTPESVRRFTPGDLKGFLKRRYSPENMVISAAGSVRHAHVVRHAEAQFGGLSGKGRPVADRPAKYVGGTRVSEKPFEQSHILIGFPGPSYREEEFFTAQVFSGLFGGGMSSRLFQEVREKRSLCYAIYSTAWGLKDAGMLGIHAATGADLMGALIDVIGAELKRAAEELPSGPELARAKAQLKAGLLMGLESSSSRAEQMARHLLSHGRVLSTAELIAKVDDVTPERVRSFVGKLAASTPAIALVGSGRKSHKHAQRAESMMRI